MGRTDPDDRLWRFGDEDAEPPGKIVPSRLKACQTVDACLLFRNRGRTGKPRRLAHRPAQQVSGVAKSRLFQTNGFEAGVFEQLRERSCPEISDVLVPDLMGKKLR